jgi:hypothetical protein
MHNSSVSSAFITGKGKNYSSYVYIDGVRASTWILENGGGDVVLNLITSCIEAGLDYHEIRQKLNISSSTLYKYMLSNLSNDLIEKEKAQRKINSSKRRSTSLSGKPKKTKGLTYSEIYGTQTPKCGFKRGKDNPNFTRDKYIGCKLFNSSGKKFRSSYEVRFSELLESHNIDYDYEHHFRLLNQKIKIVDFVVDNKLVEVTGYAYQKWQQDFDVKINLLHRSYPRSEIILISDTDKLQMLTDKHGSYCSIFSIDDPSSIINFFQRKV